MSPYHAYRSTTGLPLLLALIAIGALACTRSTSAAPVDGGAPRDDGGTLAVADTGPRPDCCAPATDGGSPERCSDIEPGRPIGLQGAVPDGSFQATVTAVGPGHLELELDGGAVLTFDLPGMPESTFWVRSILQVDRIVDGGVVIDRLDGASLRVVAVQAETGSASTDDAAPIRVTVDDETPVLELGEPATAVATACEQSAPCGTVEHTSTRHQVRAIFAATTRDIDPATAERVDINGQWTLFPVTAERYADDPVPGVGSCGPARGQLLIAGLIGATAGQCVPEGASCDDGGRSLCCDGLYCCYDVWARDDAGVPPSVFPIRCTAVPEEYCI